MMGEWMLPGTATHLRRYLSSLALLVASVGAPTSLAAQANGVPPWRTRLIWWGPTAEEPHPWRTDSRLTRFGEPGYPDDFQVWQFSDPKTDPPPELPVRRASRNTSIFSYVVDVP